MTTTKPPRLVFGLMRAERTLRRWIDARSGASPVGAAGAGVLFHLAKNGPSSITDVARSLDASPAAASGLLDRLAAAGVIVKSRSPRDARSTVVSLTDHGRGLLPVAKQIVGELNEHLTEGFSPDELTVVDRWLAHVATLSAAKTSRA